MEQREYNATDPDLEHRAPHVRRHGVRETLYSKPSTKICYFYKDGDINFRAVRMAINARRYGNLENLKKELTSKVKGLPFGVRSVFTPGGHDMIDSIDGLVDNGRYVCSTYRLRADGVDVGRVNAQRAWRGGRPPSGRRLHIKYLSDSDSPAIENRLPPIKAKYAWKNDKSTVSTLYAQRAPKKIYVLRNGDSTKEHVVLLNRRTAQNFEQVLSSLGDMFQMPAKRLFTLQGRPVKSLSAIFNGPDKYVVSAGERFQPLGALTDPGPQAHSITPSTSRNRYQNDLVARKLREKRDKLSKTRGKWKVWVTTNDLPTSGTNAQISLTVYGHKGNSGPIPLGYADGKTFQAGNIDEFEVSVGNIGEILKVRISHDNSGEFPGWFLQNVRMKDVHTGEQLMFKCDRWLDREKDDEEICRELPALRDGEPSLPVVQYEIQVETGEVWNGGTDANVYLTLYGDRGDTGVRQLRKSNRSDKFKKGSTDVFQLEAVSLGMLKRAIIGHDGTAPGDGWFLERIIVKEKPSGMEWFFPCSRWLDEGEEDGKIVRELKPLDQYQQDNIEKQMWEFEKWKYDDHNQIMLYSKFTQRPLRIKQDSSIDANGDYADKLALINVLGYKGMVRVLQNVANPKFHLAIDNAKVMGHGRGGAYCEFKIRVQSDRSVMFESNKYPVQHINILQNGKPGDPRGGSTTDVLSDPSRQFFVYCKGTMRDEGIIMFCTSLKQTLNIDHNNTLYGTGKRNKLAHFRVHRGHDDKGKFVMFESVVFPKQYIQLKDGKFDVTGKGNAFCRFKVTKVKDKAYICVESVQQKGIFLGLMPDGKVRPTVDTGEKNTRFYPEVVQWGIPKGGHGIFSTEVVPSPPPVDMKPKKVRKKKRDDPRGKKQVYATPSPAPAPVEEEKTQYEDGEWKVTITSEEAAYNTQVAMVVYGDHGDSGEIILGTAGQQGMFMEGNQDQFKVNLSRVGTIYKLRMELHPTSTKKRPEWKLQEVKLQDMKTKEVIKFKFQRWLSRTQGNRDIVAELPAVRPGHKVLPVLPYQVQTYTSHEPGADTDANVYITLFGERGDTGKRHLLLSDKRYKFQEGQVDTFTVQAVHLDKLTGCLLCHDGKGTGEGWRCDKVVVKETKDSKEEYVFPCNKWFDTSMGDRKIERMLKITDPVEEIVPLKSRTPTPLPPIQREQTPIQQDYGSVSPPIEGTLTRSVILHNLSDSCYGYDDIISVDSNDVGLSDTDDDEIVEEEKPPPAEVGDYTVWVTTGKDVTMATTNSVYLVLYGSKGVSEELLLGDGGDYFKQQQTDEIKINVGKNDLGELYKVRLGHSDLDPSSGWFLEKLKMKNMVSEEVYLFKVNRWLSRQQEDKDIWRELPVVIPGKKPLPVVIYTVEVYTGNQPGADTEATVSLKLIGRRGDSGKRVLYSTHNQDNAFQMGQMDVFKLEAVTLDEVTHVWVGHNGQGHGAGWFCDKVIVKEGPGPDAEVYYFPCGRWLDEGMDDKKTECVLERGEPPKDSRGEFSVNVTTSEDSRLPPDGTTALLTVYGEKGRSRDIELNNGRPTFLPGNKDKFEVAVGDIGELYKIRVARHYNDQWEGWHLEQMTLQDKDTKQDFVFDFNRWLDLDCDDHHTVREMAVKREPQLPVLKYSVCVSTGDHWAALTDAEIYITVIGSHGDTGKRYLTHSTSSIKAFRKKQTDEFLIEAVSLDQIEKVIIGHRGEGHGSGWFLDKIVIKEQNSVPSEGRVFPCGRWLDDHEDDRKTERELVAVDYTPDSEPVPAKAGTMTEGAWKVVITTSDLQGAGTHARVSIIVYGDHGNSGPLQLQGEPDDFEQGKTSSFKVNVGDIGEVYKVRIEHDNSGNFPAWHLNKIELVDEQTCEELRFIVNRWMAETEEDGALCREVSCTRPGEESLPVLRYYVATYTADVKNSSTSANVFITIYGNRGDTGRRTLMDSVTHQLKFLKGQIDVFIVEAVHVGMIERILIEHDGKDKDSAWLLDKVIVKESLWSIKEWRFQCSDWIEPGSHGQMASKDLTTKGLQLYTPLPSHEAAILRPEGEEETQGNWTLWVTSGHHSDRPTDTDISIIMCGTLDTSEPTLLTGQGGENHFQPGKLDEFKVSVTEIGELLKIRLVVNCTGKQPDWLLQQLKLKDDTTGQEFHFEYDRWIRPDGEDATVELAAIRPDIEPLKEKKYKVMVTTGSEIKSETDADIYCILIGQFGDSGKRRLLKSKSNDGSKFRRGQTDEFELHAVDLGQIEKVIVGHTLVGRGKGWYCDRVVIMETDDRQLLFPCNRWLDTGVDDRQIERVLLPLAEITIDDESENSDQKPASQGLYKAFVTSGGGGTANSAKASNSNNHNNNISEESEYNYADLNCNNNAGDLTDLDIEGSVNVMVYGTLGEAGPIELNNGEIDMFTPGKQDEFDLHVGNLGDLYKIRVTNALGRPWCVTSLILQDVHTKEKLTFDFSKFLGEDEGDIRKELPVIRPNKPVLPILQYRVTIETTSSVEKTSQQAPDVFIRLFGERGDSGSRHLNKLDEDGTNKLCQPDQSVTFYIEAVDLLTVTKVMLTKGRGDSLHIKQITVKPAEFAPQQWLFTYDSEITDDEDFPVKTEVEIVATETQPCQNVKPIEECPDLAKSDGVWNVWTQTGSDKSAGTTAPVQLILCGEKGESPLIDLKPFDTKEPPFKSGKKDEFKIQVKEDLGDITKIRLGFGETDDNPSWFIEDILFEDDDTKDEFCIEIHDWLKVDDEHDGWREFPVIWPGVTPQEVLTYTVEVHTGDRVGAGTDAHVYVIMHGNHGNTGKRMLKKSLNNTSKFEQGEIDKFVVEAADLGKLCKVVVGHDGAGFGSGWFLDKVVVSNDQNEVTFECDRWLDVGEDDGKIERELVVTDTPQDRGQTEIWKVLIQTGKEQSSTPDGSVIIVMYGDHGNSGDVPLADAILFKAGQTDKTEIKVKAGLGDLYKVRVVMDITDTMSWQLEKITLERLKTGEVFEFVHNGMVTVNQELDGRVEIPRYFKDKDNMLKVCTYDVSVRTKDVSGAGTDANVHLQMFGSRGDTGKRQLKYSTSNPHAKFEQNMVSVFEIQAVDLGDVNDVVVGHDGEGFGAGWYLEDITIKDKTQEGDKQFYFLCDRWLDTGEDDGQIVRELKPSEPPVLAVIPPLVQERQTPSPAPSEEKQDNMWSVMVRNGPNAKTSQGKSTARSPTGHAVIVFYGDNGKSDEMVMKSANTERFEALQTEQYQVSCDDNLGTLYKIRLGFTDTAEDITWPVEYVLIKKDASEESYRFDLDGHVIKDSMNDGWKEIALKQEKAEDTLPVIKYHVETHTGDVMGAGTDTNVYITIYGERGDTGRRTLIHSSTYGKDKFKQDCVDLFEIEAVDLLKPTRVIIGHDGEGVGAGWFLDKVIVKDAKDSQNQYNFYCERWLDSGEDDKLLERELEVAPPGDLWTLTTVTSSEKGAGTLGSAIIVIYGENGHSKELVFGDENEFEFIEGETQIFPLYAFFEDPSLKSYDLGDVYKVRIGFDPNNGPTRREWMLDQVSLKDHSTRRSYQFDYKGQLELTSMNDSWVEIPVVKETKMLTVKDYCVEVYTKDESNSGTDAEVYIQIFGRRGDTGKRKLLVSETGSSKFETGKMDVFTVSAVDLSDLTKVIIGHNGAGLGSGWFLDKVIVKPRDNAKKEFVFPCDKWLGEDAEDHLTERELMPQAPSGDPWTVTTVTSSEAGSGTRGPAHIVLYTDKGRSKPVLIGEDEDFEFEDGNDQNFPVYVEYEEGFTSADIKDVYKIRVVLDPEGQHDGERFWDIDKVILQDQTSERQFTFEFNDRVNITGEKDGHVEITEVKDKLPAKDYCVEVYTKEESNSGTDANVYLQICGRRGDTGKRKLLKSETEGNKFETGKMDVFNVSAVDLSDLTKVIIGHDGTGVGSGWFLEKVIVKPRDNAKKEVVFPCDKWLDEDAEDHLTERELTPQAPPGDPWTVTTVTSSEAGSGTRGPAHIVLYTDKGRSKPVLIGEDEDFEFTDGEKQNFPVYVEYEDEGFKSADIKDVYKIRVILDPEGQHDGERFWDIDQIILQDQSSERQFTFEFNDRVNITGEKDGQVEITEVKDKLPAKDYCVEVYTKDESNSGTDANVYLQICGRRGDTGKRKLLKSETEGNKFETGKMDVFIVSAVDLSDLTKVIIGHDGTGIGSGWFLDKVIVKPRDNAKKEVVFPCDKWLDEDAEDHLTERELTPQAPPGDPWTVTTVTSSEAGSGTRGPAHIVLYTDKGRSKPVLIGEDEDFEFEDGNDQNFPVYVEYEDEGFKSADIKDVYKIRVVLDPEGQHDGERFWDIDKITLQDLTSERQFTFEFNDRVNITGEKDGQVEITEVKDKLPAKDYCIEVYTKDESNSGTDANVYLQICGRRGDTGKRKLLKSETEGNKFETGKMDVFIVSAVDLSDLTKVIIGHDGTGMGSGWFLDKVIVKPRDNAKKEVVFPCDKWLDEDAEDHLTERELTPQAPPGDPWTVTTVTSSEAGSGTRGPAHIVLYTDKGRSKPVLIGEDEDFEFTDGEKQNFPIYVEYEDEDFTSADIKDVYKIRVVLDPEGQHDGERFWDMDKVILEDQTSKQQFTFEFNGRVNITGEKDGQVEITEVKDKLPVKDYSVEVYTKDETGSGTDANVYVQLYGHRGDTGKRKLLKSETEGNKFESGKMDVFTVSAVDLSDLTKVIIGHDGKGMGSGWFLDKVVVKEKENAKTEVVFQCDKWLDEDADDKLTERELTPQAQPGDPWTVTTVTSGEAGSGTRGPIHVVLYTDKGRSKHIVIGEDEDFKFEDGETQRFPIYVEFDEEGITSKDVENVYKIRLVLNPDNQHIGDLFWQFDKVTLWNQTTNETFTFDYNGRVDYTGDKDGQVEVAGVKDAKDGEKKEQKQQDEDDNEKLQVLDYSVEVYTKDESGSGTDANVYIEICGNRGDTGKRKLQKSENNKDKFESGNMDVFTVSAVDLSELTKVIIGHDGKGMGSGWYLDKVVVKENNNAKKEYVFPCNKWLDEDSDDKLTERVLEVSKPDGESWTVTTTTNSNPDSGVIGPVSLVFYGEKGHSKVIYLGEDEDFKFEEGKTQNFPVYVQYEEEGISVSNLGDVYKIRLCLDPKGDKDDELHWHVDKVILEQPTEGVRYEFDVNCLIDLDSKKDGVLEVAAEKPEDKLKVCNYYVEVCTKEDSGSGTDANVHVILYGSRGDTGVRKLKDSHVEGDKFETGKMDAFIVPAVDLGELTKVKIGHDGKGFGSDWGLDRLIVKEDITAGMNYIFEANRWLKEDETSQEIELPLTLAMEDPEDSAPSEMSEEDLETDGDWRVLVVTSGQSEGGKDVQVTLTVFGENGDSGSLPLGESGQGLFLQGQTDQFDVYIEPDDVGKITKITIAVSGDTNWKVDKITMENVVTKDTLEFPIDKVIGDSETFPAVWPAGGDS